MKTKLKISVITVSWNSAKTIKDTIDSVLSQTYKNLEYIIIDGDSVDNTKQIVREYKSRIIKFISEPDNGIYDAMNKGILYSSGDIIAILNSDDFYNTPFVLENVIAEFINKNVDCVFGDLFYVDNQDTDKVLRYWKSSEYIPGSFSKGWHPPHPSFFVNRETYKKYGLFDLSFKVSSDFEIMLRFLEKFKIKSSYLPQVLVRMRAGGESGRNFRNILIGNINVLRAFKKNNVKVSYLIYPFFRIIPKLKQIFRGDKFD
jgi:glycosyltransferase involved in cell wall biosynthesis